VLVDEPLGAAVGAYESPVHQLSMAGRSGVTSPYLPAGQRGTFRSRRAARR
jgi:hypothetical protein